MGMAATPSRPAPKLMEWPAPPFRRRKLAGASEGGVGYGFGGNLCSWCRSGKNVCSVVGLDASGTVVIRRNMRRETLIALATNFLHALLRWRPVAGLIISAGRLRNAATRCV